MAAETRIEYPCKGETYCNPKYGVYEYDVYPASSVLAGQTRRKFINSFRSLDELRKEYPQGKIHSPGFQRPYLGHLSDTHG